MQPQANLAHEQDQEDNEKIAAEVVGSNDLEQNNQGQVNHSSGHNGAREEVVSDESNVFLVTFGPDDAEDPLNWSTKLKWGVTAAVSGTGFNRIMVSTVRHNLCCKRAFHQECDHSFETWTSR